MKKFSALKRELKKDALYRFVPFTQNSLKSLINSTLYFSDPHYQNDPIDSNYILDISTVPDDYLGYDFRKYHKEEFVKFRIKFKIDYELEKNYGICCFSRNYNGILLWSHYTDGAKGFCFIFDQNELFNDLNKQNESMVIKDVTYNVIPKIQPEFVDKDFTIDYKQIVFNKNRQWKYESEIRIMCKLIDDYKIKDKRVYNYSPNCLKGIIVGERMAKDEIDTIKKILGIPQLSHISLFQKKRKEKRIILTVIYSIYLINKLLKI